MNYFLLSIWRFETFTKFLVQKNLFYNIDDDRLRFTHDKQTILKVTDWLKVFIRHQTWNLS